MKNTLRKIAALVLAAALLLTVCGALADGANEIGGDNTRAEAGRTVTWKDTFKISTGDNAQNLPAATFNYTIAPGEGAAASANPKAPKVNAGVGSPTISNAAHTATASGTTTSTVDVTADFTDVAFTAAGIYRYNVTVAQADSNVTFADIDIDTGNDNKGTYVLDVYVKKVVEGSTTTYEPYAYVLSKEGELKNYRYDDTNKIYLVDVTDKVSEITHEYTTYDLKVKKIILGDMAADSFDFTITLAGVPTGVIFSYTTDGASTDQSGSANYTLTATLSNTEEAVINGLPSVVTYAIQEAVNQLEGYTVTVADSHPNAGTYTWIGTTNEATAFGNTTALAIGENDVTVTFTNKLESISPTGVVMRVAPYILILGAGLALLAVSRRRNARA